MALNFEQKKAKVAELSVIVGQAVSALAADYRGLTVSQMTKLRKKAREANVKMGVYRNTLARRAVQGTEYECLNEALVGPIVLFFSQEAPSSAARLVREFVKENDKLEVKALALSGELLPAQQLDAVASLPSRDEALAQLAAVMLAPITKLVRTLNEPVAQTVRVIAAIGDQKEAA